MDLGGLDIPVRTRNGAQVYVAELDIEMTLDSASLSFRGVCRDANGDEKRSKPKWVQFV